MRDPVAEAKLLDADVNMELEFNDILRASSISFKFVALKTPSSLPTGASLPSRLFFTFKFYTS